MIKLLKEPLLGFLLIGTMVFVVHQVFYPNEDHNRAIYVDSALQQLIVEQFENQTGRTPTASDLEALIQRYVDEEILVREAYIRGIDQNDGRIRAILNKKMRFLLSEDPPSPTVGQLQAWFEEHTETYRQPELRSIEQVFFLDDTVGGHQVLALLKEGQDYQTLGEDFWLGRTMERYAESDYETVMGPEFAQRVFALPANQWTGPVRSTRGIHYLRVSQITPTEIPAFDELRERLVSDWIEDRKQSVYQSRLDLLRQEYKVIIESEPIDGD